ncbi:MAG: hypothetical protein GY755_11660 [Chloroflexi bacterium]|nr:hypothetical protein [Chloroflexota bacterium]
MKNSKNKHSLLYDIALVLVIIAGFWFRSVGLDWDDGQHLHPDERFLTMVESSIVPVELSTGMIGALPEGCEEWGGYFDTECSSLNPHNRGHGFFVYGTLPIFVTRYVAEWVGETGYGNVHLVGRQLSALADLLSVILLYFIVARVYNRKIALLSAAFSAFAVLQIQQSHFFTVDTFVNFFMFLTIYFAVEIVFSPNVKGRKRQRDKTFSILTAKFIWLSVGFGLALGMAVASKINAAVLAILLPLAFALRFSQNLNQKVEDEDEEEDSDHLSTIINQAIVLLVIGAFASFLAFRIFQPYAFSGPGFFGVIPNETWVSNIMDQRAQASGDADLPFAFQWARRSHLYSFENLTKWGLGLPLGILAWVGFLWMGWRTLKGERRHLLLWGWTAFYFLWQSSQFNPTMRYQLPIYPLLAMTAAWVVFQKSKNRILQNTLRISGVLVLVATALWAYAFVQIYQRPHTRVAAARWIYNNVPAAVNLRIEQADNEIYQQPLYFPQDLGIQEAAPYNHHFIVNASGLLTDIHFASVQSQSGSLPQTLSVKITRQSGASAEEKFATASITSAFPETQPLSLQLDPPLQLLEEESYTIEITTNGDLLSLKGATVINESSWDDGLPLRLGGYDGFGGLYQPGLNMEMYWADDEAKIERFLSNLSQGEYLFISSNRQWATLPRVPERYPLTKAYYESLIGCPPEEDVIWCYNTARPGDFEGQLGYELVEVFESFPTLEIPGLFHWEANDQFAEEAFTVYDHTKVLIFKKTDAFDATKVENLLRAVDISNVVHLTPKAAGDYKGLGEPDAPKELILSEEEWARQREGGTWSELFNVEALKNKYPILGLLLWYLTIFVLGLFTYPIVRRVFPGLADKGYPLSRAFGLLLLAYFPWLLGSFGIAYSRLTIGLVFATIIVLGTLLAYREFARQFDRRSNPIDDETASAQKNAPRRFIDYIMEEWNSNRRYYLMIEGLFLAFFLFDLLIRIGNPDLWHPSKGGERPMDLSYLHAVLKSTTFPPYDPWFAGGYLNYYYFGFVLVGTPIKLLGLTPTTAYNYLLPTLFAIVGMGAFSIGWNLLGQKAKNDVQELEEEETSNPQISIPKLPFIAGISSAAAMILLGNLGTIRAIYHAFQRIVDTNGHYADISVFAHLWLAMQGLWKMITEKAMLPLRIGDWYWFPSRVIPAPGDVEPITEFPLFTFLYSDLHAHMIVLPLAVLAIAWAVSFLHARFNGKNSIIQIFVEIAGASLIVGAMRPTNTWDLYAYLPLLAIIIAYALFKSQKTRKVSNSLSEDQDIGKQKDDFWPEAIIKPFGSALLGMGIFFALSTLFYQPYIAKFGLAYTEIRQWTGSHTPLSSYFTQWGLFLFIIISWMWWQTHEWMAETPLSAFKKARKEWVNFAAIIMLALLVGLAYLDINIGWLAVPLLFWAGLLIFKKNLGEGQRLILFLTGTGLALTIVVEVIVLSGDIGRMNTVFKLYLQTWTFFAISAGASLGWLLPEIKKWTEKWQGGWKSTAMVFFAGALLFTLTGTMDKIRDRVRSDAPAGLDGMKYMETATHWDSEELDLGQDYAGILWMRENVQGSPVIVEANTPEYRWGSRYSIYTGLPGVVGWNWHQRQQRALTPHLVTDRVAEIKIFYETMNISEALAFIEKYDVKYIVVGQVEKAYYLVGLEKFAEQNGVLWDEVFREKDTVIYEISNSQ